MFAGLTCALYAQSITLSPISIANSGHFLIKASDITYGNISTIDPGGADLWFRVGESTNGSGFNGEIVGHLSTYSDHFRIGAYTGKYLSFHAGSVERMRISARGNVGIGTETPDTTALLLVNGSTILSDNPSFQSVQIGSNNPEPKAKMTVTNDSYENGVLIDAFNTPGGDALKVIGSTTITGTTDIEQKLTVGGNTSLKNTSINGNLSVSGSISKGGGSFKIDHPLDPENKYLYHSFVESPDMMNVYNGNIITDAKGIARVKLPDYFESLNTDFRYQLTVIGTFAQAIVSEKVQANQFEIRTDKPNIEVSWQITGIRNDAYARKFRIPNEIEKKPEEKGTYLYPEAYGLPADKKLKF
ncbi:hypothetical protein D0T08_07410 [Emticicia sp. C21]|nr:hypothetical protein D0T08_07410 [Emticicia sp. C21]